MNRIGGGMERHKQGGRRRSVQIAAWLATGSLVTGCYDGVQLGDLAGGSSGGAESGERGDGGADSTTGGVAGMPGAEAGDAPGGSPGQPGGLDGSTGDTSAPVDDDWTPAALPDVAAVSPTIRLSQQEYRRTVAQAFPGELPAVVLPGDGEDGIFTVNLDPLGNFSGYVDAAIGYATALAPRFVDECAWSSTPAPCVEEHLAGPVSLLLREPASTEDLAALTGVIEASLADGASVEIALGAALSRVLLDARFLYRMEHGDGEPTLAEGAWLTERELATRLSYFLVDAPPTAEVLANPSAFEAQVETLLADPRSEEMIWQFAAGWLGLPAEPPDDSATDLEKSMYEETRRFVHHVLSDSDVPVSDLFSADYTFIDATLAEHYGLPAPAEDWSRVDLPPSSMRRGVLTHAYYLTTHGRHERDVSWIFRGKIVLTRMLCLEFPPPPPDATGTVVANREEAPTCSGCHSLMDPVGRIFDMYDEHGQLREEGDLAGDSRIPLRNDVFGEYADPVELAPALADSAALSDCMAKTMIRYALGRKAVAADQAAYDSVRASLDAGFNFRDTLVHLVSSPSFKRVYHEAPLCQ